MLDSLSSEEYNYWCAYFETEPFPEVRADRRTAEIVQALVAQATQGKNVPKISDLVQDWWNEFPENQPQTAAQIKARMGLVVGQIEGLRRKKGLIK